MIHFVLRHGALRFQPLGLGAFKQTRQELTNPVGKKDI